MLARLLSFCRSAVGPRFSPAYYVRTTGKKDTWIHADNGGMICSFWPRNAPGNTTADDYFCPWSNF